MAYLETLRFLLKTNGDVDAAIKLIEDLPIGVSLAITQANAVISTFLRYGLTDED